MRFLIGVLLLAATTFGLAQNVLKIEFSSEGPREVWIHPLSDPGKRTSPEAVNGSSVEISLDSANPQTDAVSIRDVGTGRVAMKPLKGLKSPLKLVTSDYTRLYQLDIDVQHDGKPVAVALVLVEAGAEKRQELMDAGNKGLVSFYNLPPGPYRIVAQMNSKGEDVSTPPQTFDPKPEDGTAPKLSISVNEDVEVIAPAKVKTSGDKDSEGDSDDEKGGEGKEKKSEPGMGMIGTIIGMVIGLALLGGIGYGIYRFLQVRGTETEAQLAKLGLGGSSNAPDPGPAAAPAPGPLQKIVLADSDPTPLGVSAPAPMAVGSVATPRLVRENGDVVLLTEGASDIGREAAIALPGESSVSRRHASIERQGASVVVNDLGSTNGTWVNGRRIDSPTSLQPGDQVMFGGITFRYEV
jgi:hypothetical protein